MNLNGTSANDSLDGSPAADHIAGLAGNDTLWGGAGNDTLWGGDGYDAVDYKFTSSGSAINFTSQLNTGPLAGSGDQPDETGGIDFLNSIEELRVLGSQYHDTIIGQSEVDIFQGDDGDDTLTGGAGFDAFVYNIAPSRFSGIDVVTDLGGGDAFHFYDNSAPLVLDAQVQGGNNSLFLTRGQVMIESSDDGVTYVYLGTSDTPGTQLRIDLQGDYAVSDFIVENRSWGGVLHYGPMQTVIGANGEDRLVGTEGTDYFQGNGGNDTLVGNGGNDTLDGGNDHDQLSGGSGNDLLSGGEGDDRIGAGGHGEGGDDTVNGGGGWDTAVYDYRQGTTDIVFASSGSGTSGRTQADPLGATDTLQNIEQVDVYGGAGNDSLTGDAGWNALWGGDGNDTLAGLGGPDAYTLRYAAGTGIDRIVGFDTSDFIRIEDETGNDLHQSGATLSGDDASALGRAQIMIGSVQDGLTRIYVGTDTVAGADLMFDLQGAYLPGELWTQDRLRIAEDGRFLRSIELTYAPPQNQTGTEGPDTIFGAAGTDALNGAGGNDTIYGGDRADTIHGGEGSDLLLGGRGNDQVFGDGGDDVFADDMDFDDLASDTLDGGTGVDAVQYDYSPYAGGFELVSSGTGLGPRTQAMPMQGTDILIGIEEVRIRGSQGADTITGDAGRNWIEGHDGNDTLTGNGGNDRFSYDWTIPNGIDRITDFGDGDEFFFYRFSGAVASLSGAIQTGTASSSLGNGQVMVGTISTGVTRISIGTNDTGGPDLRIDLQGTFTAADFTVENTSAGAYLRLEQPPAAADLNGDGNSDILWRHSGSGGNAIWRSGDVAQDQPIAPVGDLNWKIAGVADFNGDGTGDVLWRHATTGDNVFWRGGDVGQSRVMTTVADLNWKVAGLGDFNGDGQADVLWRNVASGDNAIWRSGDVAQSQAVATVGSDWQVAGAGDLNGDGRADLVWRNTVNGDNSVWYDGSISGSQSIGSVPDTQWKLAGIGDFNGDGQSDLLWRHAGTGDNAIWRSGFGGQGQAIAAVADLNWQVAGTGDYNGDGVSDILWRNAASGDNAIWRSADVAQSQGLPTVADTAWTVQGQTGTWLHEDGGYAV